MYLATISTSTAGIYAVTESIQRPTARAAYQTARRLARIEAREHGCLVLIGVNRIVDRSTAPRFGGVHAEWICCDHVRASVAQE